MKNDRIVAIEIDGILTASREVRSTRAFAALRDGAREFIQELIDAGYAVTLFTQRVNTMIFRDNISELRRRIIDWAESVKLPRPIDVSITPGLPACGWIIAPQCLGLPGLDRLNENPREVFTQWFRHITGQAQVRSSEPSESGDPGDANAGEQPAEQPGEQPGEQTSDQGDAAADDEEIGEPPPTAVARRRGRPAGRRSD